MLCPDRRSEKPGWEMERGEEADSEAGPRLAGPGEEALHVVQVEMVRQLPKWIPLTRVKQEPAEELLPQSWEAQWQDFLSAIQSSHPGMGRPQRPEVAPWGDTEMTLVHVENPTVNSLQAREKQVVQWVEDRPGPVEQALSPLGSREGRDDGKGKEESQHMLSPEEERLQFRHFAYEEAGAPQEAYSQLHKRCHRWLRPEKQTKERILDILILEQFLTVLPQEMQEWVAESSPETCAQAVALAERFLLRQRDSKRQDEKVLTWLKEETVTFLEAEPTSSETTPRRLTPEVTKHSRRGAILPGGDGQVSDGDEELQGMLVTTIPNLELQESFVKDDGSKQEEGKEGFSPLRKTIVGQGSVCEITFQQRIHKGNGRSLCPLCGKSFSTKSSFNRHQRIHTGEKPYECPDCSESFLARSNLIRHQRIHTGEKPYRCSDCGKRFSRSANLITHRRSHTGEKPYKCSGCGKMFNQSAHLIKHQRTHVREQPYECTDSGKGFSQETALSGHQRMHPGDKLYECTECRMKFCDKSSRN